jgi:hypothetical protein
MSPNPPCAPCAPPASGIPLSLWSVTCHTIHFNTVSNSVNKTLMQYSVNTDTIQIQYSVNTVSIQCQYSVKQCQYNVKTISQYLTRIRPAHGVRGVGLWGGGDWLPRPGLVCKTSSGFLNLCKWLPKPVQVPTASSYPSPELVHSRRLNCSQGGGQEVAAGVGHVPLM